MIRLGVEVRERIAGDERLVLSGVANAMPCTVGFGGHEHVRLMGKVIRRAGIGLVVKPNSSSEPKD